MVGFRDKNEKTISFVDVRTDISSSFHENNYSGIMITLKFGL